MSRRNWASVYNDKYLAYLSGRPQWDRAWLGECAPFDDDDSVDDMRRFMAWISGHGAKMRERMHDASETERDRESRRTTKHRGYLVMRDRRSDLERITIHHYPPSGRSRFIPSGGSGRGWFSLPYAGVQ